MTRGRERYSQPVPFKKSIYNELLSGNEVFLQGFHIVSECLCPRQGNLAGSARHLPFEAFLDGDVPSFGQFVDLHAQVARGGARMLL